MKTETLSIVSGSDACDEDCFFCVSKTTPPLGITLKEPPVNWANFRTICNLAVRAGVTTAMITSKGEATLFPEQITKFLRELLPYGFLVELQTNGRRIYEKQDHFHKYLTEWHELGLRIIAISMVHYEKEKNKSIRAPRKPHPVDLPKLIEFLHSFGFTVRLCCILVKGFIDTWKELDNLIEFTRKHRAKELTITPVNKPDKKPKNPKDLEVWEWIRKNCLSWFRKKWLQLYPFFRGNLVRVLSHGAKIYDIEGQNFCFNNCLSVNPKSEELRNLIFFPDGTVITYWQYPGSVIL